MMKIFPVLVFSAIASILSSCNFGWSEFFHREDQVNSRTRVIEDFDGTEKEPAPELAADKYSVMLFSDIHFGAVESKKADRLLEWFKDKQRKLAEEGIPPLFIICLGDISNLGHDSEYKDFIKFYSDLKTATGLEIYTIPGNHDLYNSGWENWQRYVFPHVGAYRFSTSHGEAALSWYFIDTANGTLGNPQIEDLEKKLKADSNEKIVISHYPIYGDGIPYYSLQNINERDVLISMFAKNKVKAVIAGHLHPGRSSKFGDYFYEEVIRSAWHKSEAAVMTVDMEKKTYDFIRCGF